MKISDLKVGQGNADIEAEVTEITEPREIDKFGRSIRVATATIQDDSGSIKMTLWNQDIEKVTKGSRIKVTNGYVNEFQGEKQFTAGKFGKIEIVSEGEGGDKDAKPKEKEEGKEIVVEEEEELEEEF